MLHRQQCNSAILLCDGKIASLGSAYEVLDHYVSETLGSDTNISAVWENFQSSEVGEVTLSSVELVDLEGKVRNIFGIEESIKIIINYKVNSSVNGLRIALQLRTSGGITTFTSYEDSSVVQGSAIAPGKYRAECIIPPSLLNVDIYHVLIGIDLPKIKVIVPFTPTARLQLVDTTSNFRYHRRPPGVVCPNLKWAIYVVSDKEVV